MGIVPMEREDCSSQKENCMATKCCNVAGYYCYEKNDTFAQCAKTCSPSASNPCRPASETLQLEPDYSTPKRSLFCFSVYREHWFAQTELRIGSLDWAVCEEGEHLRLRQVRGLRRCGGVSGWRLLD